MPRRPGTPDVRKTLGKNSNFAGGSTTVGHSRCREIRPIQLNPNNYPKIVTGVIRAAIETVAFTLIPHHGRNYDFFHFTFWRTHTHKITRHVQLFVKIGTEKLQRFLRGVNHVYSIVLNR